MNDWDASQYLKFEDDRNRAARDLLTQVPLQRVRLAIDLGCGPGNSTEILVARYPEARIIGLDSSQDMLNQARQRLPACEFIEGDVTNWKPSAPPDLFFANATFQWVPDHPGVMKRLVEDLPEGGVLAAQMPDNTREPSHLLMRKIAGDEGAREDLPPPEVYYDVLKPLCRRVDIWHTIYNHSLAGPAAIVEWFRGSALRPFLKPLDGAAQKEFLVAYTREIAAHYQTRPDGQVLLRFPRLFVVATR
jgi:trans-aconitate 2-methyltransferase